MCKLHYGAWGVGPGEDESALYTNTDAALRIQSFTFAISVLCSQRCTPFVSLAFIMSSAIDSIELLKGKVVPNLSPLSTLTLVFLLYITSRLLTAGRREKNLPPGPPTIPILGNLHQIPLTGLNAKYISLLLLVTSTDIQSSSSNIVYQVPSMG